MKVFYKARLETRNFEFEALGPTAASARKVLREGLRKHEQQYGLLAGALEDMEPDIEVEPFEVGVCYRDREAVR